MCIISLRKVTHDTVPFIGTPFRGRLVQDMVGKGMNTNRGGNGNKDGYLY